MRKNRFFVLFLAWLAGTMAFGQSTMTDRPLYGEINKVQPMTGIVFWSENTSALQSLREDVQLEYSYLVYSDVINERGKYDWSSVDDRLEAVKRRGHQAIFRFRYTYPGQTRASVPKYVRDSKDYNDSKDDRVLSVEGKSTYVPDWSSRELEDFTIEFYRAFAERYDNDARIAFLQLGFGSYAEYHLYRGPVELGKTFPSKRFQSKFLKEVDGFFQETPWSLSIDAQSDNYSPFRRDSNLKNLGFGLFDDSFMHINHSIDDEEYNRSSWLYYGRDRYQTQVCGGEFSYYNDYDQEHVLDLPNGPHGRSFESFAIQYHLTYIIGNDQYPMRSRARIKQASMVTGYRFEVTAFRTSENEAEVTIGNKGIAPLYHDAYPAVNGVRSKTSLKGLQPGESKTFTVRAGGASPSFSIESDRLVPGQVIQFEADLEGGTDPVPDTNAPIGTVIHLTSAGNGRNVWGSFNKTKGTEKLYARTFRTGTWTRFLVEDAGQGHVALKAVKNNRYISIDESDVTSVKASGNDIGAEQRFFWEDLGEGKFALRSAKNNRYITVNRRKNKRAVLETTRADIGTWETFTWSAVDATVLTSRMNKLIDVSPLKMYPNPAQDFLHVAGVMVGDHLRIYDTNGTIVKEIIVNVVTEDNPESIMIISSLRAGSYFLKINDATPLRFVKK